MADFVSSRQESPVVEPSQGLSMSAERSTTKITTGGTISMFESISSVPVADAHAGIMRDSRSGVNIRPSSIIYPSIVRKYKKSGFWEPPEPQTVPTYDLDGIAVRIPASTIPDQGTMS
jgi:hypothetical protein